MEVIQYSKKTKAIKDHVCGFCSFAIERGSIYFNGVYKYDGIYSFKTHIHCEDLAQKLGMYDDCEEGLTGETFREYINDECRKVSPINYDKFTFKDRLSMVRMYHNVL